MRRQRRDDRAFAPPCTSFDIELKAARTMMSPLNHHSPSTLSLGVSLNPSLNQRTPTQAATPALPQVEVAQNKRFANIMAKTRAMAPQVASPAPTKPAAAETADKTDKAGKAQPSTEASRAEANARSNAKAAARLLANRDTTKAQEPHAPPQTPVQSDPSQGPQRTPNDNAALENTQSEDKSAAPASALSADMAAWVAALNPVASPATTPSATGTGTAMAAERSLTDFEANSQADSAAADLASTLNAKAEAQDLRKEADAAAQAERGGMPGSPGMLGAASTLRNAGSAGGTDDQGRSPAKFDGDRSAGRDGRRGELRGVMRDFNAPGADSPAPLALLSDMQGNAQGSLQIDASPSASALSNTTNAASDFSALLATSLNGTSVPTGGAHGAHPVLTLSLPTPLNAPEFREALGVQVSLLARDGVQTAELHLNPAEMGPVSIRIVMDGTQARVDFGADVAATRAAIEAGMPELASAMLEAGFTLAGGGVSQHAKGQNQPAAADNPSSGRRSSAQAATDVDLSTAAQTTRRVQLRAGGVDVFA